MLTHPHIDQKFYPWGTWHRSKVQSHNLALSALVWSENSVFRCSAEIHIKFLPFFDVCWLHHIFPHVMQVSIARKKETAMTPYFSGQAKQLADHIRLWSYYASRLKVSNWGKLPLPSTYIYYVLLYSIIFMFGIVATATGFELASQTAILYSMVRPGITWDGVTKVFPWFLMSSPIEIKRLTCFFAGMSRMSTILSHTALVIFQQWSQNSNASPLSPPSHSIIPLFSLFALYFLQVVLLYFLYPLPFHSIVSLIFFHP